MFTGLIQERGQLRERIAQGQGARLVFASPLAQQNLQRGESIAVDGVCLTVEEFSTAGFSMFASLETLERSTLGDLASGTEVNLERALAVGDRLGGHWVTGHVDARGILRRVETQGQAHLIQVSVPESARRLLVEKGSVAVDGISLTVAALTDDGFTAWIIPETWRATTLSRKQMGDPLNIECDLIGKYVFRYLELLHGKGPQADVQAHSLLQALQQGGWATRSSTP